MVQKYSSNKNPSRSYTMLNGNLMKQVYCPNPTSTNLGKRKRRKVSQDSSKSLRESSNLEKVVTVIRAVRFSK
jgi:hypothetical protein